MEGGGLAKSIIYRFSGAIFLKCIQGRFGIKKLGFFHRMYFMDRTLTKNSAASIFAGSCLR